LIKNLFSGKKPVISFEIFPPKKDSDIETIYTTLEGLKDLNPDFISVTYGAGGSTSNKTLEIASLIKNKYSIESLAHLTSVSLTKTKLIEIINELKKNNVNNILALRGDFPQDINEAEKLNREYQYASDLIRDIKSLGDFSIGGACYPEGHLECMNLEVDIRNLKKKIDSGTDFLITQLFFDNDYLYKFRDNLAKNSITVPISAGIMPVTSKKQIERIVELSGATLPAKFVRIMEKYEHNPEALKEAGTAYATEQIIDLLSSGIDGIHLYTMNRPDTAKKIIQNIGEIRSALEKTK
jgi:methylenetetrahydrofolate reductase (NADPH)